MPARREARDVLRRPWVAALLLTLGGCQTSPTEPGPTRDKPAPVSAPALTGVIVVDCRRSAEMSDGPLRQACNHRKRIEP